MAIAELKPFLEDARKNKYCLGCFNVFNIETLEGVIEAAVNLKSPVVCAIYEPQFKYSDLEIFSNLVKEISGKANIPVILHLDHAEEISSIINAIRCGFTSVMYDGPVGISFEEKKKNTKKVVEIAHSVGVVVEAELGYIARVGADENVAKENIADPNIVAEFVNETGVDVVAPAIGTIHGLGHGQAILDLDLLRQIKSKTDCFLSLHGGSGVSDKVIKEAIDIGINKSSVYTKISEKARDRLKSIISDDKQDLAVLLNEVRNGFREKVEELLKTFQSYNICSFETSVCNFCSSTRFCVQPMETGSISRTSDVKYSDLINKISNAVIKEIKDN